MCPTADRRSDSAGRSSSHRLASWHRSRPPSRGTAPSLLRPRCQPRHRQLPRLHQAAQSHCLSIRHHANSLVADPGNLGCNKWERDILAPSRLPAPGPEKQSWPKEGPLRLAVSVLSCSVLLGCWNRKNQPAEGTFPRIARSQADVNLKFQFDRGRRFSRIDVRAQAEGVAARAGLPIGRPLRSEIRTSVLRI